MAVQPGGVKSVPNVTESIMSSTRNRATAKIVSLSELAERIADNTSVGIGGVFLHRGPFALIRELVRQKRRGLDIIKPSPGYDLDLLCRAGAVAKVRAGIVAMEGNFGLARWYRKAIERKEAHLEEHA
jgi:glutaconate CoA-transferase subunit A